MAVFSRSNMFSPDLQGEVAVQHFFTKVLDIILNFLASKNRHLKKIEMVLILR